ncbi:MAG: PaaI family thioesterase [Leptospiraceae bacterium]|nr:PaaI family thioesterase [Leptospiraceae bacterium]
MIPKNAIKLKNYYSVFFNTINPYLHFEQYYCEESNSFWLKIFPEKEVMGPPGHVHGGCLSSLLDEAMGSLVWISGLTVVTAHLETSYRKPVPLNSTLYVLAEIENRIKRKVITTGSILNENGDALTTARGIFIIYDHSKFKNEIIVPNEFRKLYEFNKMRKEGKSFDEISATLSF